MVAFDSIQRIQKLRKWVSMPKIKVNQDTYRRTNVSYSTNYQNQPNLICATYFNAENEHYLYIYYSLTDGVRRVVSSYGVETKIS